MGMKVGIGQDSHRFLDDKTGKKCVIAGLIFDDVPGLDADSDGDVVFHSLCNAITSVTHVPILGKLAIHMCKKEGITDSRCYLEKALETLQGASIVHVALAMEGARPRLQARIDEVRGAVAETLGIHLEQVGLTITSGDALTAFGRGEGLQCFAVITVQ
ncbi:MAG: 2-C-methyl-D-erythritol 2,4-cyclodiphosphate synthase [Simkaniaceae bacterium]|nr:2-C-methyl-D-erythritol 2,4-cyclodiphosphate synthase [Simkaniaceae bacterium]